MQSCEVTPELEAYTDGGEFSDFESVDDCDAAHEGQEFYIDFVSTEDNHGLAMDLLRFMHKSRDREPMVPAPHLIEMMNPGLCTDRQVAVSRFIVTVCGSSAERYLDADDPSERWVISVVNDTSCRPRTRLISARQVCCRKTDSFPGGEQTLPRTHFCAKRSWEGEQQS